MGRVVATRHRGNLEILQSKIASGLPIILIIQLIEAIVRVEHLLDFAIDYLVLQVILVQIGLKRTVLSAILLDERQT